MRLNTLRIMRAAELHGELPAECHDVPCSNSHRQSQECKMIGANIRVYSSSTGSRLKALRHRPSNPSVFSMESPSAASSSMPRSNLKSDSEKTCGMVATWSALLLQGRHHTTQNPSRRRSGRYDSKHVGRAAEIGIGSPSPSRFITAQRRTPCHVGLHCVCVTAGEAAPRELEGAGSGEVAAKPQ